MSTNPVDSQILVIATGEPTLFDSLARLVPEELQAEYYRVLTHTRPLNPGDKMLRILEAMSVFGYADQSNFAAAFSHANFMRKKIARAFNQPQPVFVSGLHALTAVRNVCAHHYRLWN